MKRKSIIACLLFLTFFFLCFVTIPQVLRLNFISSGYANKLAWYPLVGLLLVYIYEKYEIHKKGVSSKEPNFKLEKYFYYFISIYFILLLVSLIHGLIIYPYYEQIFNGPVNQIEKLPTVLSYLHAHGITLTERKVTAIWMFFRIIKGLILSVIFTFGFSYVLYYFINKFGWTAAFKLLKKGVFLALAIIFVYSSIELFYLVGNETALDWITKITPFFHDIENKGTWWPPLLWYGQLRSIFAEPPYFGVYALVVTPLIWSNIMNNKNKLAWIIVHGVFTFLIFATQSRIAILLFFGELFLLFVFNYYYIGKKWLKDFMFIVLTSILAFFLSVAFWVYASDFQQSIDFQSASYDYLENNVTSVFGEDKRSNNARYAIAKAKYHVGMDHFLLGVGNSLESAYLPAAFPKEIVEDNHEVSKWIENMEESGILKSPMPIIGDYTHRFVQSGILGFGLFVFPWLYILFCAPKKVAMMNRKQKNNAIAIFIALIASLVSGLGTGLEIFYISWTMLSFAYAIVYDKSNINRTEQIDEGRKCVKKC